MAPSRAWLMHLAGQPMPTRSSSSSGGLSSTASASWKNALAQYLPGGGYGKGTEESLNLGRTQAVTGGMQALISSGMANTTMPAGLAKKYESEVATPARANVESTRAQALAGLYAGQAGAQQGGFQAANQLGLGYSQLGAQRASSANQLRAQQTSAANQLGLGYAQLGANKASSANSLAMQKYIAELQAGTSKPKIDTGGYGGSSGYNLPSSMNGGNTGTYSGSTMAQGYGPYGPGTYQGAGLQYAGPSPSGNPWGYEDNLWG